MCVHVHTRIWPLSEVTLQRGTATQGLKKVHKMNRSNIFKLNKLTIHAKASFFFKLPLD